VGDDAIGAGGERDVEPNQGEVMNAAKKLNELEKLDRRQAREGVERNMEFFTETYRRGDYIQAMMAAQMMVRYLSDVKMFAEHDADK
jgi:hypothetical protein